MDKIVEQTWLQTSLEGSFWMQNQELEFLKQFDDSCKNVKAMLYWNYY